MRTDVQPEAEPHAKVQRVNDAISRAESLVVALDETVAELVEMLRAYSERCEE